MNSAKQVDQFVSDWKSQGLSKTEIIVNTAEAEIGWPYAWGATGQYCTAANRKAKMANARIADGDRELIRKRCQILNGSTGSCDGCAYFPDGEKTRIFDCIGFINKLLDYAGADHYGAGCSIMWNHEANWTEKGKISDMPETVCLVFQQEPNKPNKMQHIGLYIGNGWVIHCSKTAKKQKLSEYPWTHYGALKGLEGGIPMPDTKPTLRKGSKGQDVTELQTLLIRRGYDLSPYGADGSFGNKTLAAVQQFQRDNGLTADGVAGSKTWAALTNGEETYYTVTIRHISKGVADAIVKQYGGTMTAEKE